MTTAASLIMLLLAMALDRPWDVAPAALNLNPTTWIGLLTLDLVSTTGAYVLYFRVLASAGATNLSLVTFLIPIAAQLLGMSVILTGSAVIEGRLLARFSRCKSDPGSKAKTASRKQPE